MTVHNLKNNKDFNSINKDTIPLDTRIESEYDIERALKHEYDNLESSSCHSRAIDSSTLSPLGPIRGSRNKDIMPLDSRIKCENDNIESSSCHSGLRAGIQRDDNLMPKAFRFAQSGRSMVEMLGTLAIIGVLSIGGIMGYSYAVDKYHANQIMNDVNLRGIDLIAQASRGGDLSLAEWPTKTSSDLDIGLEVDEATNTTEGGIYVKDVEKDICEIIADDLLPEEVELVIDGEAYTSGKCGEMNKMVFYYDAIGEALGGGKEPECNGVLIDGVCMDCPENATVSADGRSCECPEGFGWNYESNTCEEQELCYGLLEPYIQSSGDLKGDVVIDLQGNDIDLGNEVCPIKVNGTLTIKNGSLHNIYRIGARSLTSHGIILENARLENVQSMYAETKGNNTYALHMDSSNIMGHCEEMYFKANGTNGGVFYLKNSALDADSTSYMWVLIRENAGNEGVNGSNSFCNISWGGSPIPETETISISGDYWGDMPEVDSRFPLWETF